MDISEAFSASASEKAEKLIGNTDRQAAATGV